MRHGVAALWCVSIAACSLLTSSEDLAGTPGRSADGGTDDDDAPTSDGGADATTDQRTTEGALADGQNTDGACGPFADPPASSLVWDFNAGLGSEWNVFGSTCVSAESGELVAKPPADSGNTYCHATTTAAFHLTCDSFTVKVPEVTANALGAQTVIYIAGAGGVINVIKEASGLAVHTPDASTIAAIPNYSASEHLWWRFRESGGELYMDTSADGVTFTERGHGAVPFPLDSIRLTLGAGVYKPVSTPGQARFDCYNVPPPCP